MDFDLEEKPKQGEDECDEEELKDSFNDDEDGFHDAAEEYVRPDARREAGEESKNLFSILDIT